jgi:hypothetical protein
MYSEEATPSRSGREPGGMAGRRSPDEGWSGHSRGTERADARLRPLFVTNEYGTVSSIPILYELR